MARKIEKVTLKDVRITFRNFSGKESQYNRKGDRNFAVLLDPDTAAFMVSEGWAIKQLPPREEGDLPQDWIKVKVNFDGSRGPQVTVLTSAGRTELDEDTVGSLDLADIERVDLILNPYEWSVNGNSGVTAYLHKIFVTIREDELDILYNNLRDLSVTHDE